MALLYYHVNWPSATDPMYVADPTEAAARISYYSVNAVPSSTMDGVGNAFVSQPNIDANYAVASPFDMNLTHTINGTNDSIFITCKIKCTQAVSVTGPMICQVAIVENHIAYTAANGEKLFYNTMRKMLPNSSGTSIAKTWAVGDSTTLTFAAAIPTYITNKLQLAVVAFVQDNATKAIEQAAYSAPLPMPLDASVSALNNIPAMQCSATFTPTVVLQNAGLTTLTSATISYKIDNGTAITQPWTGSLAAGNTTAVNLPIVTGTSGSHTFTASVSAPNAGTDQNSYNDAITKPFIISLSTPLLPPMSEGFVSTTFPPANWALQNSGNTFTWTRATVGGFGNSNNSAKIAFCNIPSGTNDLIALPVDLTGSTSATMTFNIAHAQYSPNYIDELQVLVSTDCGTTWHVAYDKSDPNLATLQYDSTAEYTAPTASQWRTDSVNLNPYIGQGEVFVNFHGITGYGNDLFIDDVNITKVVGINEVSTPVNFMNVYPNPFISNTNVEFTIEKTENVSFELYNILGEKVLSIDNKTYDEGKHKININANNLNQGVYFLHTMIGNQKLIQKLTIIK